MLVGRVYLLSEVQSEHRLVDECVSRPVWKKASVTVTVRVNIGELDLVGYSKWIKMVQNAVLAGPWLWVTLRLDCTKWTKVVLNTVFVGRGLWVTCCG